jgi:hypothetical protein
MLINKCIDVMCISETWLNSNFSDKFLKIDGYNLVRKDRLEKRGGGVCMYIRDCLQYCILKTSRDVFDNKPEFIILEIIINKIKMLCSVVYRRPRGESINCFINEISTLLPKYEHCCICGDINMDFNSSSSNIEKFKNTLRDFNLTVLPIPNTHVTSTSQTTLDIFIVPSDITFNSFGKICVPDLSSHSLIYAVYPIDFDVPKEKVIKTRDYSAFSLDRMLTELNSKSWISLYTYSSINLKVGTFNNFLLSCWDKLVPLKNVIIKKKAFTMDNKKYC